MERAVYDRMAAEEDEHWWFVGRRRIVRSLLARNFDQRKNSRILEAGCGTGGNLQLLSGFGRVDAFEHDEIARVIASGKSGLDIASGSLPDAPGGTDSTYDLVCLFDVLEHIEDDVQSLSALSRKLLPGGILLITVPAMPFLWSDHDVVHHHKRRYTRRSLRAAIRAAGLQPVTLGYFNTLLFPLALMQRLAIRIFGGNAAAEKMPGPLLNRLLATVFGLERHLLGNLPLPFGLSLFAIVKQPT